MTTHLVWLRNDLRITDNKALHAACNDPDARVLAVFIATPHQWRRHGLADRQIALIHATLKHLQQALAQKGIPLYYHQCDDFSVSIDWLIDYCLQQGVTVLFYNRQYALNEWRRDKRLEYRLAGRVRCQHFNDSLLLAPGSVTTSNNEMYKIYTPFRNAFIRRLTECDVRCLPAPQSRNTALHIAANVPAFSYSNSGLGEDFPAGEQNALQRLGTFCRHHIQDYITQRDLPAIAGTSSLSPYLAIGTLSPRQCFNRLCVEHPRVLQDRTSGAFGWLNELIWREFYGHLMAAYPELCKHRPFIAWTDQVCWRHDESLFQAWQRGETGYPIVDAGMRQLNNTGWMHNRLRMISASFLVKDLLIDWRTGERYFMSQLLDGDFASNNGGWQWAASTGTDAAPYFRIFNPTTQGKRFDPRGIFIRQWLPELAEVPDNDIHQPHLWAKKQHLILDYPLPVVDHKHARLEALASFETAKGRFYAHMQAILKN
ncbi:Deoxyribodipyrimidine photo-lyase [Serratia symbiotica]|nr:Deoxyribodipyrimidine photo-lyase [Serratia symbiotica]